MPGGVQGKDTLSASTPFHTYTTISIGWLCGYSGQAARFRADENGYLSDEQPIMLYGNKGGGELMTCELELVTPGDRRTRLAMTNDERPRVDCVAFLLR